MEIVKGFSHELLGEDLAYFYLIYKIILFTYLTPPPQKNKQRVQWIGLGVLFFSSITQHWNVYLCWRSSHKSSNPSVGDREIKREFCEKSKFDIENGLRQVLYPVLDEKPRWRQNYTKILENAVFWSFTTVFWWLYHWKRLLDDLHPSCYVILAFLNL